MSPNGRSACHWHLGDELIYVQSGSVDVLFRNNGLRARLKLGDYLHFHAEQEHCVFTGDGSAELVIVRFQPTFPHGEPSTRTRKRRRRSSASAKASIDRARIPHFAPLSDAELTSTDPDRPILDKVGLGRFLKSVCSASFRGKGEALTLDMLADDPAAKNFSRAKLQRIHNGQASVTFREIWALAIIHKVDPILLCDYLFPVVEGAVVIRQEKEPRLGSIDTEDLIAFRDQPYRIPCRKLADTSTSISMLDLPPGKATLKHRHPGHELLLPLNGEFELDLGGLSTKIDAGGNGFVHFDSRRDHILRAGRRSSKILVIRVYHNLRDY